MTAPPPDRSRAKPLSPTDRVRAECLALSRPALLRSAGGVAALALAAGLAAMQTSTSLRKIILWLGVAMCGTIVVVFVAGWRDHLDTEGAITAHHREIVSAATIAGMCFGAGAWLLFDSRLGPVTTTASLAIIAMAAALAVGLQLVPGAAIAVLVSAVAPMFARFVFFRTSASFGAAGVVAVAAATLAVLSHQAAENQVKLVRNRLENEMLGRRLQRAVELGRAADEELGRLQSTIEETQHRDQITGAFNRRQLTQRLADAWTQASNGFDPFSLALIEIDRYDSIVEAHGPKVADELLRQAARVIAANLRTDDVLARLSGSQFAVVLQNTMIEGALIALERIRRGLSNSPIDAGEPLIVKASIGVVTFDRDTLPREMLLRVDDALGAARRNGGNRITVNEAELRDVTAMV
jgi:diguanylate cyclase (GGDEF)-like protein